MSLPRRRSVSFRVHLTLWYVLTLGVVLALSGYAVNLTTRRLFQLELDDELRAEAQTLAAAYDPSTARISPESLGALGREGRLFALLDVQGNVTQYGGTLDETDVPSLRDVVLSGSDARRSLIYSPAQSAYGLAVTTIERDQRVLGMLVVGAPELSVGDMTHRHLFAVLAIFALTLVVGDAAHLQQVFERFYRADTARTAPGGHGLGLAIARGVARGHGGEISARNRPGAGVAFEIVLPSRSS